MAQKTVAKAVVENLRDMGVKHVFGVPSGGFLNYMEAIRTTDGIEFVLSSNEGGAGFMADICGRLTGKPGVCFGTYGPGATYLSTGVGSAQLDRSPLIALTDEMPEPFRGRVVQMGIDHQALMRPITKWTTRLDPDHITRTFEEAARVAMSGRPGAVHIGMPTDLSGLTTDQPDYSAPSIERPAPAPDYVLDLAREALANARKPVLVAGLSAVRAGLGDRIAAFAERHKLPVVLTPMAKGLIPESHPCYAGVLFHALSDQVSQTHSQADLVVAVGYDPVEFSFESWMQPVKLVNIDDAPLDIDPVEYADCLTVRGSIAGNFEEIGGATASKNDWNMQEVASRTAALFDQMRSDDGVFGPCAVLDVLREVLPADGIMACDVGAHTHLIGQKWLTPEPGTQLMTNGWSAMGFGVPAAIAAKLCLPDRAVCAVVGDGGLLMTAGELATAARENLNVVIVVLTDNNLALTRIKQERKDNPIYGNYVRSSGTIGGENIFGVKVRVVRDAAGLKTELSSAFKEDGPVIVEAIVNSGEEYDRLVLRKDKA